MDFYNVPVVFDFPKLSANETACMELQYHISTREITDGLFLEFGVWKGRTINHCARLFPDLTFYGFDSFEGLPEDWPWGPDSSHHFVKKEQLSLSGQMPKVENNVILVKGWYDDVLPDLWKRNEEQGLEISVLHLDCDVYSSTKTVLDVINSGIVPGTIIRFDDLCEWRAKPFPYDKTDVRPPSKKRYMSWPDGQWKALNEWIDEYNREIVPLTRVWNKGATVKVIK